MPQRIQSLADITPHYDVILCDVWGVLHNGIDPFLDAAKDEPPSAGDEPGR